MSKQCYFICLLVLRTELMYMQSQKFFMMNVKFKSLTVLEIKGVKKNEYIRI
jgi:hypothetical protein